MKKIMMTLAAAAMAVAVNAQVYLGGSLGIGSVKVGDGDSKTAFNIIPEVGYNIDDTWAVGLRVGYQQGSTVNAVQELSANEDYKAFTVEPYARFTFAKFGPVNVFTDLGLGYTDVDDIGNNFYVGLRPGVAVNLSKNLSFVSHVGFFGYNQFKNDDTDVKTKGFGLDMNGNNLTFGLYYNF